MMSRRVNAVLALGTTDHVLPSPTPNALFCQKRNFPTLFRGNEIFQPLRFGNSVIFNRFRLIGGELLGCAQ
jgi:hypothetical protein